MNKIGTLNKLEERIEWLEEFSIRCRVNKILLSKDWKEVYEKIQENIADEIEKIFKNFDNLIINNK